MGLFVERNVVKMVIAKAVNFVLLTPISAKISQRKMDSVMGKRILLARVRWAAMLTNVTKNVATMMTVQMTNFVNLTMTNVPIKKTKETIATKILSARMI
jgi:hypothetical protein